MKYTLVAGLIALALPVVALAHESGRTFEKSVGTNFIDIGFDNELKVGQTIMFDFSLTGLSGKTKDEPIPYDTVTLKVASGSDVQTIQEGTKPDFGKTTIEWTPVKEGHWTFSVAYLQGKKSIASADFPADIKGTEEGFTGVFPPWVYGISSVAAVAALFVAIRLRSHRP